MTDNLKLIILDATMLVIDIAMLILLIILKHREDKKNMNEEKTTPKKAKRVECWGGAIIYGSSKEMRVSYGSSFGTIDAPRKELRESNNVDEYNDMVGDDDKLTEDEYTLIKKAYTELLEKQELEQIKYELEEMKNND